MIHKRDGRVLACYESGRAAARAHGLGAMTVNQAARLRSISAGEVIWRLAGDWEGSETFAANSPNRPVIVAARGRLQWFGDCSSAAAELRMKSYTLQRIMRERTTSRDGVRARYATGTDDWPRLQRWARGMTERS